MITLEKTLQTYDPVLLGVIADRWDVDLESHSITDITAMLVSAMRDPDAAAATWDRLTDEQRGAMQTLLASGGKMPAGMFFRLYGEIREMGPGRLEREKPYLNPISTAEALYYRGLIAQGFDQAAAGNTPVVYVPTDLMAVLPAERTGFDLSAEEADDFDFEEEEDESDPYEMAAEQPDEIFPADTTLVDDLTTLLAYLQVAAVTPREGELLPQAHVETLTTFLLNRDRARLDFLLGLAQSLALIGERDGLLKPVSQAARKWLEAPRSEQVRLLATAWRDSVQYNDLRHTPGLIIETVENDPRLGRQMLIETLKDLPLDSWWIVDAVVEEIRATDPDFQRPGGDYESWYIRSAEDNQYLNGWESWDAVDGAMLRFMVQGPMHWLGLADLGRYKGRLLGRLNAYGRAFVSGGAWPSVPEAHAAPVLHDDGTVEVSRRFSRYERFQLARFTEWLSAGEPYRYRFSLPGLRRAAVQGIEVRHVRAFLGRVLGTEKLPDGIDRLLERWAQTGQAEATIATVTVLRMTSAQALDAILEDPAVRRYLGARLGPEAVIVRPGQAAALQTALAAAGILAELEEGPAN
ncbi:MAG: hypothetical protein Kow0077_21920 [Anaerolineae bacterium]